MTSEPRPVAVNLLGVVEHPALDGGPWRIDRDGAPYVPVGDGGIVLDLQLGDSVFRLAGDHAAPGACLTHADVAARHALSVYACIGNTARVRTGRAAGARGVVLGQRGEKGRVIVGFGQADLARMRPSDQVTVRAFGQGMRPEALRPDVMVMNLDPDALALLPVAVPGRRDAAVTVGVRMTVPSKLAGNGIGRAGRGMGPGPAAAAARAGRCRRPAAGGSGRGHRPRRTVEYGVSTGLDDGRRGGPRGQSAARARAGHHARADRAGRGVAATAGSGRSRRLDRGGAKTTVTDDTPRSG